MKTLLSLFALIAVSGSAFAQTEQAPAAAPAPVPATPTIPTTPIFKDVPPNHWAFAAVQRLASAGIIEGYPATAAPTTQTVAKVAPAPAVKVKAMVTTKAKPVVAPKAASAAKVGAKKSN